MAQTRLTDLPARGVILFGIGEHTAPYGLEPFLAAHLTPRIVMEVDSVDTRDSPRCQRTTAAFRPDHGA